MVFIRENPVWSNPNMDKWLGLAAIVAGTFCFSAKAVFVKLAYRYQVDPVVLMTLRMGLSLPCYLFIGVFVLRRHKLAALTGCNHMGIIATGIAGYYFASLFDLMGLQYISAGFERLILYLYPTIVILLSAFIFKVVITKRELLALLIGYAGIAIVFVKDISTAAGEGVVTGSLLVLASALAFAVYIIGSARFIPKLGAMGFTVYAMTSASVAIFIHFVVTRSVYDLDVPTDVWWIALAIALISTILPTFLMAWGIKHLGAPRAALAGMGGPAFTGLLGYLILGESYTLIDIFGMVLVVVSVSLIGKK